MVSDQDRIWHRRHYDSYRPAYDFEPPLEHHSSNSWDPARFPSNIAPQGYTSWIPVSSVGQSGEQSAPTAAVPDKTLPSSDHHPEQQMRKPKRGLPKKKSMPDTASLRSSSQSINPDERSESEAQKRGIYGSSRLPASISAYFGRHMPKAHMENEATDHYDEFELDNRGQSRPRAYNARQLTEAAFHPERKETSEHAHEETSLPELSVEAPAPSRDESERQCASRNPLDPRVRTCEGLQSQHSASMGGGAAETRIDHPRQGFPDTRRADTSKTYQEPVVLIPSPGIVIPQLTRPRASSRDPRQRYGEASTPLSSTGESLPADTRSLGEPSPLPFRVHASPSQAPVQQQEYKSHSSSQRETYVSPASNSTEENAGQAPGPRDDHHSPAHTTRETDPSQPPSQAEDPSLQPPSQVPPPSSPPPAQNVDPLQPPTTPSAHPAADETFDAIEARMWAQEDKEESARQRLHEKSLEQMKKEHVKEVVQEVEKSIKRKREDAEVKREEDVKKVREDLERWKERFRQR